MTIAAGFKFNGGALLGSRYATNSGHSEAPQGKGIQFFCQSGSSVFAYVGSTATAVSTIQKCQKELARVEPREALATVERILDQDYHRNVYQHPSYATGGAPSFNLLFALCAPNSAPTLHISYEHVVNDIPDYGCVGIGEELAHHLVQTSFDPFADERAVLSLAAYTLARVKECVDGCSGVSQFVVIRDGSQVAQLVSLGGVPTMKGPRTVIEWLERQAPFFEQDARELLFKVADINLSDAGLGKHAEDFKKRVVGLRKELRKQGLEHEAFVGLGGGPRR